MQVHALGIGGGRDNRGAYTPLGADRAEQVCGVVTAVADHQRPRADGPLALPFHPAVPDGPFGKSRPHVCMRALLSDPIVVLKPDLDRSSGSGAKQAFFRMELKFSLKACCVASSFLGRYGH